MGIPIIVEFMLHAFILLALSRTSTSNEQPAIFVFGDSLVDVGNNNYIVTLSKANFVPFGIDVGGPTGRFTNGRTIIDIIGQELGIGITPPYLAPTTVGPVILNGVNYASGGGGILNITGKIFGGRINFDAQIDNFANTRQDIISSIGVLPALDLFERAIFSVTMGSNDFINNYLTSELKFVLSPKFFVADLMSRLREQLTRLYNLGARKFVVTNVGPIGCIPSQRDTNPASGDNCAIFPNQLAQLFNNQLKDLLKERSSNLEDSIFVYADIYRVVEDITNNYITYGFENPSSSCCHLAGRFGGLIPCGPTSIVCLDRSKYVFWDPFHPTEAANVIIAKRLLEGDGSFIYPMNVRQLFQS